ncbi:TonB-dependent receptor [Labilibacter sediminis]|nr:TonB-dependent receptor [Labilibacter sediminis]
MTKKTFLLMFLCLQIMLASAQNIPVTGKVLDELGQPLIGATVVLKDAADASKAGTITDFNGVFRLTLPANGTLIVSFIGYEVQEVPIGNKQNLTIAMKPDMSVVDEVVVVGFGTQKKETVVGSISQAKGDELVKTGGVTSVSEALTGLLPGVVTLQNSSQPGDESTDILIRGKSSWNNNSPLVLVDGAERPYDQVDPNEIESISVLKDASATAVFGIRGANGVILITTKRGEDSRAKISFNANMTAKQMTSDISKPSHAQTMRLFNEAMMNDNSYTGLHSEQEIAMWENGVDPYFYPEVNWEDVLLRDFGWSQNANLNVSGGNKFMKYFTSVGYTHEGDIFKTEKQQEYDPRFSYNKYNFRSNFDFDVTNTTKVSVNLSGIIGKQTRPGGVGEGNSDYSKNQFFNGIYSTPNYLFPVQYENGQYGDDVSRELNQSSRNMLVELNHTGANIVNQSDIFADFKIKQDLKFITKGLSFNAKLLYTNKLKSTRKYKKKIARYSYASREDYEQNNFIRIPGMDFYEEPLTFDSEKIKPYKKQVYQEASLNYSRTFDKHNVTALLLALREETKNNVEFEDRFISQVARVTYNYDSKYLFEFNGSRSGINWFHPDSRMEDFYSGAIGWIISEENFIKDNLKFIDKLKLRYSWGESGSYKGFSSMKFDWAPKYETKNVNGAQMIYFGDPVNPINSFYLTTGADNKFAFWEVADKQNLGIELEMFRKLAMNVDLYKEKRTGVFAEVKRPSWAGLAHPVKSNIGETKTQGFEIETTWRSNIGSNIKYWITNILAYTENRIVEKGDSPGTAEYQKMADKPIGTVNRLLTNGFYNSWDDVYNMPQSTMSNSRIPGDLAYIDYNADGIVDDVNDPVSMEFQTFPAWTSSINLGVSYKGFQLSALFYGAWDVYKSIDSNLLWEFANGDKTTFNHSMDRWTPENATNAKHPALHLRSNNKHNMTASEYSYRDAKYIRLKTAELSYTVPQKMAKKMLNMNKFEIFVSGNNLLTFTDFDNRIDPEQGTSSLYPIVRRFNAGVRVGF